MNKKLVVDYVGGGDPRVTSKMLGYSNENQVYHLPEEFTTRQKKTIIMRMKAAGFKIPEGWE